TPANFSIFKQYLHKPNLDVTQGKRQDVRHQPQQGRDMQTHFKKMLLASAIALSFGASAAHAEIKIGLITTLSGGGAALGQDQRDGFMLAVEQNGGKLGGQDVNVIVEDDQLKPELGVQIARKLVNNDKVDFVTG